MNFFQSYHNRPNLTLYFMSANVQTQNLSVHGSCIWATGKPHPEVGDVYFNDFRTATTEFSERQL